MIYPGSRITARFGLAPPRSREDPYPKPTIQPLVEESPVVSISHKESSSSSESGSCHTSPTRNPSSIRRASASMKTEDQAAPSQCISNIDENGQGVPSTRVEQIEDDRKTHLEGILTDDKVRPEPYRQQNLHERESNQETRTERNLKRAKKFKKCPLPNWFHRLPSLRRRKRSIQVGEGDPGH